MSENPKSFSPIYRRRRSSLPSLGSLARCSSPATFDMKSTEEKPERKFRKNTRPSSAIDVSKYGLTTKRLLPVPPTTPKSGKTVVRKRPVTVNCIYPRKSTESLSCQSLTIVGKAVRKTDKGAAKQASKLNVVEEKIARNGKVIPQEQIGNKTPSSLDKIRKQVSKISPTRSFEELTKGSRIPVYVKHSQQREQKSPSVSQSQSLIELTQDNIIQDVDSVIKDESVFIEEPVKSSRPSLDNIAKNESYSEIPQVCEEEVDAVVKAQLPSRDTPSPVLSHREKPARPTMDVGRVDIYARHRRDLVAGIDNSRLLSHMASRVHNTETLSTLREILPSKFTPERTSQEKPGRNVCLGKSTELADEIAMRHTVKEFGKVHEQLIQLKRKYTVQRDHESNSSIMSTYDTATTSHVRFLKNLANEMSRMVVEVDTGIEYVQNVAQNFVEEVELRFDNIIDNLREEIKSQQQEIGRLKNVNFDLEYSIKEKDCNFESLGVLVDNMNGENERLELRCREMEENNDKLTADNEKCKLDMTFRLRELKNLRCDVKSRDTCSSEHLGDHHTLWKERNTLNIEVALLQSDLNIAHNRRMNVDCNNNELKNHIDKLQELVKELGGQVPEFEEPCGEPDSYAINDSLTGEYGIKPVESILCLHPADEELNSTNDLTNIGLSEHMMFLNEGQVQNGVHDKTAEPRTNDTTGAINKADADTLQNDSCILQIGDSEIAIPQKVANRIMNLELAIQERDIQLSEFQNITDSLKERNEILEFEKQEEISKHEVFRQETLEEAKQLRDIGERLREKEKRLHELLEQNSNRGGTQESTDDDVDWFEECIKASKRIEEMESCMQRQDDIHREIESQIEDLKVENKKLRESTVKAPNTDSVFQKMLQDIEKIVIQLQNDQVLTDGTPKDIRFYSKTDLAIKELQRMQDKVAVLIVGDADSPDNKTLTSKRIGKKKSRKMRKKQKINDLINTNRNNRTISNITEESLHGEDPESNPPLLSSLSTQQESESAEATTVESFTSSQSTQEENNGNSSNTSDSPLLLQAIQELKAIDVDAISKVLQNEDHLLRQRHSSLLMDYRQSLSTVHELEGLGEEEEEEVSDFEEDQQVEKNGICEEQKDHSKELNLSLLDIILR